MAPKALKILAEQILCLKNWWFFPKTAWKNLVEIPSDKICPPKFIWGAIFPPR
jgi:hypothetical protein